MTGLVIDTSGSEALVILAQDGQEVSRRSWPAGRENGVKVLEGVGGMLAEKGLEKSDLDRIGVVVEADAHFMGLRAGVATANALALGLGVPIVELKKGEEESLIIQLFSDKVKDLAQPKYGGAESP